MFFRFLLKLNTPALIMRTIKAKKVVNPGDCLDEFVDWLGVEVWEVVVELDEVVVELDEDCWAGLTVIVLEVADADSPLESVTVTVIV